MKASQHQLRRLALCFALMLFRSTAFRVSTSRLTRQSVWLQAKGTSTLYMHHGSLTRVDSSCQVGKRVAKQSIRMQARSCCRRHHFLSEQMPSNENQKSRPFGKIQDSMKRCPRKPKNSLDLCYMMDPLTQMETCTVDMHSTRYSRISSTVSNCSMGNRFTTSQDGTVMVFQLNSKFYKA